jgi:hypothetical protein
MKMLMSAAHTPRARHPHRVPVAPSVVRALQSSRMMKHIISHLNFTRGRPTRRRASSYRVAWALACFFNELFTFHFSIGDYGI